ncbi:MULTISPECIES: FkbM family methyltransferase [unclassified Ruegeria]|uniref:FkbM family methyltransferase n=1 Tax=unclassified Ruegeria TaxID=2625375 RepID=UPI001491A91C|nr:FkbM family methyltransferase [Ruegeria sp. HKCCD5849]NOD53067.1 FkbM family methyltransferase [Ruegeria sp. HKCCD5851]NOD66216.1 FkbM family methyltransferase [Ruegeria sp. HKCCD7303]
MFKKKAATSDSYFPLGSDIMRRTGNRLRKHLASLGETDLLRAFEEIYSLNEGYINTQFRIRPFVIEAHQENRVLSFPRPLPLICLEHISFGYVEWLRRKYTLPGFVEVEKGDVVIDCGGFVGGFTVAVAPLAKRVLVVEPAPTNAACIRLNTRDNANVEVLQLGLSNHDGLATLHLSSSGVEHSILAVDDGETVESIEIASARLDTLLLERDIKRPDFLKLEAEGFEPEIFEGTEHALPRKMAIDISPERDGESAGPLFEKVLTGLGYSVRVRRNVLFARKD